MRRHRLVVEAEGTLRLLRSPWPGLHVLWTCALIRKAGILGICEAPPGNGHIPSGVQAFVCFSKDGPCLHPLAFSFRAVSRKKKKKSAPDGRYIRLPTCPPHCPQDLALATNGGDHIAAKLTGKEIYAQLFATKATWNLHVQLQYISELREQTGSALAFVDCFRAPQWAPGLKKEALPLGQTRPLCSSSC